MASATVRRIDVAMKYYLKVLFGLDLFLLGTAAVCYGLYQLTRSAMSAVAEPAGAQESIAWMAALLVAGVFVGLIGMLVASWRGDPPGLSSDGRPNWIEALGTGLTSWGVFFLAVGATLLLAGYGPGSTDVGGIRLTLAILGGVFIVMGLVPLILAVRWAIADRRPVAVAPAGGMAGSARSSPGSTLKSRYETADYLSSHPELMRPPQKRAAGEAADTPQKTPDVGAGERSPTNAPAAAKLPAKAGGAGDGFEGDRTAVPGAVAAPPAPDAPAPP